MSKRFFASLVFAGISMAFVPPAMHAQSAANKEARPTEKKLEIKWDMDYLQKTWGVTFKSAAIDEKGKECKILLEFARDTSDLQELKQVFQAGDKNAKLWFLFFDEDNVAFGKSTISKVEGELTGKAGEAFRIAVPAPTSHPKAFAITKKVSARPGGKQFTESIGKKVDLVEKKTDGKIKWDLDYLEESWGIAFKSATIDEAANECKLLLEFTRDMTNLQEIKQVFQAKDKNAKLWFLFFDEDNVAFAKSTVRSEGELTGKAGEAFRITVIAPSGHPKVFALTRKIAARPSGSQFVNSLGMKFEWIPPGTFRMGSPEDEPERTGNETAHKVTLSRGFYMGVTTVTQGQWQTVMGKNPSHFKGDKDLPVEMVSWKDCQEFCKKLQARDKKPYRLPTEAEWEYACRAGTTTPFYFGKTVSADQPEYHGHFGGANGKKGLLPEKSLRVGSFAPNPWGLYDMHGNVWQWCQDWHADYPQEDVIDPQGPDVGEQRVLRGGSWHQDPACCRAAYRNWYEPDTRYNDVGFRICFFPETVKGVDDTPKVVDVPIEQKEDKAKVKTDSTKPETKPKQEDKKGDKKDDKADDTKKKGLSRREDTQIPGDLTVERLAPAWDISFEYLRSLPDGRAGSERGRRISHRS